MDEVGSASKKSGRDKKAISINESSIKKRLDFMSTKKPSISKGEKSGGTSKIQIIATGDSTMPCLFLLIN